MNSPLVSILVPLYNHAKYIEVCLDSIRDEGWPVREVVIVDDGSSDDSAAIARAWYERQEKPLFVRFELVSRPNKGLTRTLNELIAMANGEYLILLASDDYLLPGGIGSRVEYLQTHPDKLAVFSDCIVVDETGKTTHDSGIRDLYNGHLKMLKDPQLMDLELIFNWCVPGPVFMAKRELYERLGGYDERLLVEDWDMYLRISARGLLGFIPGPVAAYRFHAESTVASRSKCIALTKCHIKSTWKYAWHFHGLRRLGLLYQHFRMKREIAEIEQRKYTAFFAKKVQKLLRRFSLKRYQKIAKG